MRRSFLFSFVVGAALLGPPRSAAQQHEPLRVHVESPTAGIEDVHGSVTQLVATVSDPTLATVTLTVHGASYDVPVTGGRIEQSLVVVPGVNRVVVTARRGDEVAVDSVSWFVRGEPMDLLVLASWESQGEIVDLWVREPGGETCKWDHRETATGGRLLDFSGAAIGFGSQGYVTTRVQPGTYRIKLHYWGGTSEEDARWSWDLETMLSELHAAEQAITSSISVVRGFRIVERDRIAARLDRWAGPAAPQAPVWVEAILFPGTRHERRWRFERLIRREGDLATLGEIEIDAALVRAVRAQSEAR